MKCEARGKNSYGVPRIAKIDVVLHFLMGILRAMFDFVRFYWVKFDFRNYKNGYTELGHFGPVFLIRDMRSFFIDICFELAYRKIKSS